MLDVVFIMLIFFIVTTSFSKESGLSISRPSATQSESRNLHMAVIELTNQGEATINNRQINILAIRSIISKLKAQSDDFSALIIPQFGTKTGDLITVMDQIKQAKVDKISIATAKKS